MTLEIEYPDGHTKTARFDQSWIDESVGILWSDAGMNDDELEAFAAQPDWRDSPTFLRLEAAMTRHPTPMCGGCGVDHSAEREGSA